MMHGMNSSRQLCVFTDLDGTLLDHDTYSWQAAKPALERLARVGVPLILTSSKTGAEISKLQQELGLVEFPAIVENGGGTLYGTGASSLAGAEGATAGGIADDVCSNGSSSSASDSVYRDLRARLNRVSAPLRQCFEGFGDLGEVAVSDLTGLSLVAAQKACKREFTEPGLWSGSDQQLDAFLEELYQQGVSAQQGGRFLTLSFGSTKADAMQDVMGQLGCNFSIALGDAPNDVAMLEAADRGIIIVNRHRAQLPVLDGEREGRILRSHDAGPVGWNHAMLQQLDALGV